jgi:predicted HTH transcriptional regulator
VSGKTSGKILKAVRQNKEITIPELSASIGITERSIERNIQKLQREKFLLRIGPAKGGHWELIEKSEG